MSRFPEKLNKKLQERTTKNALRILSSTPNLIDFSSNDYLGFAKNESIYANTFQLLLKKGISQNGATGSRLLSGNHDLYAELENKLAEIHKADSALIFNSGYDANMGFFSSVPQRSDIVFYDEYSHASIRDGISMGNAKSYKFKHNNLEDLKSKCEVERSRNSKDAIIYIVTESVFSMDGDSPDLITLAQYCMEEGFHLIVDEAHAVGVVGKNGLGLVQDLGIEKLLFARMVTFGKALGCHGAAILGDEKLKLFLVNFARSFIYTTGLPPHAVASITSAYDFFGSKTGEEQNELLKDNINFFKRKLTSFKIQSHFVQSDSAIQSCIVPENDKVKTISSKLLGEGFDVKAILSPTVQEGQERLRFCIHSFNTKEEIGWVLQLLKSYL